MIVRRILFGLDRLPRGLPPDDPRLPGITLDARPLRLNSEPLPAEAPAPAAEDHSARVAVMTQWLCAQCGDYAPQRQHFMRAYLASAAAHLQAHRAGLALALKRFHGLYAPEDWLWSALRPLPRAWLVTDAGVSTAEIAFWDGAQVFTIGFQASPGPRAARDTPTTHITAANLVDGGTTLLDRLPTNLHEFWRGQTLPCSPFRRPIPDGVLIGAESASTE